MNRLLFATLLLSSARSSTSFSAIRSLSTLSTLSTMSAVSISDAFDGGNIEFVKTVTNNNEQDDDDDDKTVVILKIKPDPFTQLEQKHHFQYFCFRSLCSSPSTKIKYVIENAGESSYPNAWTGSTIFYSPTLNDPHAWKRLSSTTYENGQLSFSQSGSGYFSYFPPYSYDRHLEFMTNCGSHVQTLGQTLDGRELDCVKVGSGKMICWIIHRQHPGETMAEYYAEGLIERLLGTTAGKSVDGLVAQLLKKYTFYIVPNMCPDGSVRGHLRTNAQGQNLNREWDSSCQTDYEAPTLERSPEVYHILNKMQETGVDAFLDVHGDEELPFNFLAGSEGLPNWGPRLQGLHGAFLSAYGRANSDMQAQYGYAPDAPLEGKTMVCSNQIATRFDCFAATLEMPYKDLLTNPDPERGWSPARSKQLGASVLDALSYIHPYLRTTAPFWEQLPPADDYVCPTHKYNNKE